AGGGLALFFTSQGGDGGITQLVQTVVARLLVGDGVGFGDGGTELGLNRVQQRRVLRRRLPVPSRLGGFGSQFLDGLDGRLEFHVGEEYRTQHLVLGQLLGLGF